MAFHSQLAPSVARPTPVERLLIPPTPQHRGGVDRNGELSVEHSSPFLVTMTGDDDFAASALPPFPELRDEMDAMAQDGGDGASFQGLSFLERRFGFER